MSKENIPIIISEGNKISVSDNRKPDDVIKQSKVVAEGKVIKVSSWKNNIYITLDTGYSLHIELKET